MLYPLTSCGLGSDLCGSVSSASLPVPERPPAPVRSSMVLRKFEQFVITMVPLPVLSLPNGKKGSSKRQWHVAPWRPMSTCAGWIVLVNLPIPPRGKIQKAAMTLLCDTTQKRDFASPIATRASKILEPISRHLKAEVIPMIRNAAQPSRSALAVGILRVLCNGMCTAKRFRVDNEEQTCRVGCTDEPDCLTHCNRCTLLYNIFFTIWRNAGVHLQEDRLFHDFFTLTSLRSLQFGIVVMGIIDAFVYAQNTTVTIRTIQGNSRTAWKGEFAC